jgi:predicted CoA-binding protein
MMETANKVTVVIGTSNNPDRYRYMAMHALINKGHIAIPLGIKS